jgi:hypothetical protein
MIAGGLMSPHLKLGNFHGFMFLPCGPMAVLRWHSRQERRRSGALRATLIAGGPRRTNTGEHEPFRQGAQSRMTI